MKRTLLAMFLVLVALVSAGSASAAIIDCSAGSAGTSLDILEIQFDSDEAFEPGATINLEVDIENSGLVPTTVGAGNLKLYVYDSDGNLIDDGVLPADYPQTLTNGPVTIEAGKTKTVKATWIVDPSNYVAYDFDGEHQFDLYIQVDETVNCDVSSEYPVTLDNHPRVSGITSKIATEDSAFTYTASASDDDNEAGEPVIDVLTFSLQSAPSGMSIVSSTGAITWTPRNENVGVNTIIVKVSDGVGGYDTESFQITVANTNDAPVLSAIPDYRVQEGLIMSPITLPGAQDIDVGDVVSYSLSIVSADATTFDVSSHFDASTKVISGWVPVKNDVGELQLKLTATDLTGAKDDQVFTVDVYPKVMCESGEAGNALDLTINNPESGDDFGPGDIVKIEANVANSASDDKDVVVKAVLYDVDTHKKLDEVSSSEENVESDGDLDYVLELELPLDADEDWKGKYVIYIMAYEEGKEDEQCLMDSVSIDIGRDTDRVIVQEFTVTPYMVEAGDSIDVTVDILSIGKDDQREVYVKVEQSALGIDLKSEKISLDEYDGDSVSHTFRFTNVPVSSSASASDYTLFVTVYYDGKSDKYTDSPLYVATSAKNVITVKDAVSSIFMEVAEPERATENSFSVPITITNTGNAGEFTLSLSGVEDFANAVSSKIVYLGTGDEKTEYFTLELKDDAKAEKYVVDAILKAPNGNIAARETFEVDLSSESSGSWLGSKTFWIIGDIVLIVVALFFLKLIFGGRRPDVQEVKL